MIKISVTKSRTLASGEVIPTVEECCTKESMEKAVMEENETRFTRCLSSVFFGALLLRIIGVMFDGQGFWNILNGSWVAPEDPELTDHAKDLLEEVRDNSIPP